MPEHERSPYWGHLAYQVEQAGSEKFVCKLAFCSRDEAPDPVGTYEGRSVNHALAVGFEHFAQYLRRLDEFDQDVDWLEEETSADGDIIDQRFHVILHYERVVDAESKFEAKQTILDGNTVIENASITVIKVEPDVNIELIKHGSYDID